MSRRPLTPPQQARVRRAVLTKHPDQVALPGLVWTRPQVDWSATWFGIRLSRVTIGKYLRSWGLSPQKPIRRAYEQNPETVARWLEVDYPAIAAKARKDKAIILWLDQTGLRSDAAVGTTWAPVGQTPVVGKTGTHRRHGPGPARQADWTRGSGSAVRSSSVVRGTIRIAAARPGR